MRRGARRAARRRRGPPARRAPTTPRSRSRSSTPTPAARARSPGIEDVSLTLRLGEVLGRRRRRRQRAARARRGDQRPAPPDPRRDPLPRRADRLAERRASARSSACATSPTTGSARGSSAALPVSLNLVLKRIGQPPYWRGGRIRRDAIDRDARALVERFDIRTPGHPRPRRHAVGRQHPEGPARARAVGRRQGRRLPQADLRPRPARPRASCARMIERAARRPRGAGHLDRPRRAARGLRPDRRALARADRRRGRERPGRRRADRPADDQRRQPRRRRRTQTGGGAA